MARIFADLSAVLPRIRPLSADHMPKIDFELTYDALVMDVISGCADSSPLTVKYGVCGHSG
jgi:hypothetical protein